ncbi:IclR family transcriptional regulator [Nocardia arizonensis]|uniref:IclR family transcriptional regulator n=1 Tax=Nocardia arizonensis TaxID=1141647 RepID=UPI0006D20B8A|nr:helix-turn-helix domain-containing protein [Nocardia arizonensis]
MVAVAETDVDPVRAPSSMVERITSIMEVFDSAHSTPSLEQVSKRSGLPRSTAYRILEQLIARGWVVRVTNGYRLGARSLRLGNMVADEDALRAAAAPVLRDLAHRCGRAVQLAVLDGNDVRYLERLGGPLAVPRAPAHRTAPGRAILAVLDPHEVDGRYRAGGESAQAELHADLARVRSRHGIAVQHMVSGARAICIAAPVRGPRGLLAAVSVLADAETRVEYLSPLVAAAARAVQRDLTSG